MVKVGDKHSFVPSEFATEKTKFGNGMKIPTRITGKVVWIHPKGRFFLVEAFVHGIRIRETFPMERR